MNLYPHLQEMRDLLTQLKNFTLENPLPGEPDDDEVRQTCGLVAKGLQNFIDNLSLFEACLTVETPFMAHFLGSLRKGRDDDDTGAEQLLEDLVIFFREKALRLPPDRITQAEREIMQIFEDNQILEEPESMTRRWYWNYLPLLVQHDYLIALGLDRPEGKEYLRAATGVAAFVE